VLIGNVLLSNRLDSNSRSRRSFLDNIVHASSPNRYQPFERCAGDPLHERRRAPLIMYSSCPMSITYNRAAPTYLSGRAAVS
jgi:hypothetical protein